MTANAMIAGLRARGVALTPSLRWTGPVQRSELAGLAQHKLEIVAALVLAGRWTAQNVLDFFDERLAVREHEGGLAPDAASRAAIIDVIDYMQRERIGLATDQPP
ncbi:MAG: hypothetical protein IT464_08435 [Planctomycetes bacterium]|nr:hypothetical protein [Planctomycetota bacterium]